MDALVVQFAARLPGTAAVVALGAFGRQELTPRSELELLFLHRGGLSAPDVTERVCYPLWSQDIHVEPLVRTVDECAVQARRSWAVATRFLDARPLAGDARLLHTRSRRKGDDQFADLAAGDQQHAPQLTHRAQAVADQRQVSDPFVARGD